MFESEVEDEKERIEVYSRTRRSLGVLGASRYVLDQTYRDSGLMRPLYELG